VTECPSRRRYAASAKPPKPAPIMSMFIEESFLSRNTSHGVVLPHCIIMR
jgi:hypothetical protein